MSANTFKSPDFSSLKVSDDSLLTPDDGSDPARADYSDGNAKAEDFE